MRAHEAILLDKTYKSEQALAAKVCWTMPALSCISRVFVALTIDDSVQNDVLAAKLEQASTALTSKVCLFYIGF